MQNYYHIFLCSNFPIESFRVSTGWNDDIWNYWYCRFTYSWTTKMILQSQRKSTIEKINILKWNNPLKINFFLIKLFSVYALILSIRYRWTYFTINWRAFLSTCLWYKCPKSHLILFEKSPLQVLQIMIYNLIPHALQMTRKPFITKVRDWYAHFRDGSILF